MWSPDPLLLPTTFRRTAVRLSPSRRTIVQQRAMFKFSEFAAYTDYVRSTLTYRDKAIRLRWND